MPTFEHVAANLTLYARTAHPIGAAEKAGRMDRDLVEQSQRGEREAFAILARSRGDRLFGIARRILRDVDLAEDATQQALIPQPMSFDELW